MLNTLSVLPFILSFQLKKKFKYLNILGFGYGFGFGYKKFLGFGYGYGFGYKKFLGFGYGFGFGYKKFLGFGYGFGFGYYTQTQTQNPQIFGCKCLRSIKNETSIFVKKQVKILKSYIMGFRNKK